MIYLDYNATTPLDPRVLEKMLPFFTEVYGNAASQHSAGMKAKKAVDHAREQIAELIGSTPQEIIFTSGATESINLAIKGLAGISQDRKHIVTVSTEHKAVLDVCAYLETIGFEVTYLPVQTDGLLDIETVKDAIRPDTLLISVMYVNNETGIIQPIQEISTLAHAHGAFFMTDATQAVGKMPVDVEALGIDLMAFSAHKFYGPKGVGGLYVRSKRPFRVKIQPLQHGGGHEGSFRSGTLNVTGIVGMGEACAIAQEEMTQDAIRIGKLRDQLENELLEIPGSWVNGNRTQRLYNVTNMGFEGVDADAVITSLPNISMATGSACTAADVNPSHVLIAMGKNEDDAYGSLRLSLGKGTTKAETKVFKEELKNLLKELRDMSFIQSGNDLL
ncbi:MAG: cysteine desulfurase family protein [Bacteroidota bacterium]